MKFITKHESEESFNLVKNSLLIPLVAYIEESGKTYCWNSKVEDAVYLYCCFQGYTTEEAQLTGLFFMYEEDTELEARELYKYVVPESNGTMYCTVKTRKISKIEFPYDAAEPILYGFMETMAFPDETPLWASDIYAIYGYVEAQENRIVIEHSIGSDANDHDYVDLGLTSGTKWAKYNVGATGTTGEAIYGGLYQWGGLIDERNTKDSKSLNWNYCPFQTAENPDLNTTKWSKYISQNINGPKPSESNNAWDNEIKLELQHDVAHSIMGGDWHMPTTAQITELVAETTSVWLSASESEYGVAGRLFTSTKNSNTLFIPAAGYRDKSNLNYVGSNCSLWSNSLYHSNPYSAWGLFFDSGGSDSVDHYYIGYRYYGCSVRGIL